MSSNPIVLITPNDFEIGLIDKETAHKFAMLHRAFSVVVYRIRHGTMEILLQRRQLDKYHCGGLWTNTCCSHPLPQESNRDASERRLMEEMGIQVSLTEIGRFHYVAVLDNGYFENELDYVLVGVYDQDDIPFNPEEVAEARWMGVAEALEWYAEKPAEFTPWFKQAIDLFLEHVS